MQNKLAQNTNLQPHYLLIPDLASLICQVLPKRDVDIATLLKRPLPVIQLQLFILRGRGYVKPQWYAPHKDYYWYNNDREPPLAS